MLFFSIRLVIESKETKDNCFTIDQFSNREQQQHIDCQTVPGQISEKMVETSAAILPASCSNKYMELGFIDAMFLFGKACT